MLFQGKRLLRRAAGLALALFFFFSAAAFAAGAPTITNVRFGKGDDHDRIVLDVSALPKYATRTENDGRRIILELTGIGDAAKVKPIIHSDVIHRVRFTKLKNSVVVTIDLEEPADFVVKTLKNPDRVFIDIQKEYEFEQKSEPASGLVETIYTRRDGRGRFRAFLLDVDLKKYDLVPVLANGEVLGRTTVSRMSDEVDAVAAINSNYFATSGEILGMLRMDGTVVGTTYFTRSALGVKKDGLPFVDQVYYSGKVTIGKKSALVSGVNAERGSDALIIYNRAYDVRTNTNQYGKEFVVQDGKVTKINQGNSVIPENGYVISVHGTAKNTFSRVRVGDKVTLEEDLGAAFQDVPMIVGAGPTLVKKGKVSVTADEEEFPDDIARGRAPRTGVAVLPNRHVLLAVVDGRQEASIGATLTEFAELFVKYGAKEAVNFDGGGSSAMVVGGKLQNSPSDGEERRVGSALAVMKKKDLPTGKPSRKK